MNSKEAAAYAESEMSQFRPCPFCGQYGGVEQHQAGCAYTTYKEEEKTPLEESPDSGFNNASADVVSEDETSLPSPSSEE